MAEDGVMPNFLSKVYVKYNEPRYALIGTAILAISITISTNLEQPNSNYELSTYLWFIKFCFGYQYSN